MIESPISIMRSLRVIGHIAAAVLFSTPLFAADIPLFNRPIDLKTAEPFDARVTAPTRAGYSLRLATGHSQSWPGVTLNAPEGRWDLSPFYQVAMKVHNAGSSDAVVQCRLDSGATPDSILGSVFVPPGRTADLYIRLTRPGDNLSGALFGMKGLPASAKGIDPSAITRLVLFLKNPTKDHLVEIGDICATGVHNPNVPSVADAEPFFPFIDTFGQYKHQTWPGKTRSIEDLAVRRESEAKELAENPGPKDWDQYGGWAKGPLLKATGFFRTEKRGGKWWLVDPEGRLFFSQGIDCVRMFDATPTEGRDTWFKDFPGGKPEFEPLLSYVPALHGYYAGKSPACFSFRGANLVRKYGPEWETTYRDLIHRRLRNWGINTIGNWSEEQLRLLRKTPYVDTIVTKNVRFIEGSSGFWSKFPDVFDPGFAPAITRAMSEKKGRSAGDPWCIGFFCDNEMGWGQPGSLAYAALLSPADQPAKIRFAADLKAKYGKIAKLNAAWKTSYASWNALLADRTGPGMENARIDLDAFYTQIAETYFRTVRDEIKAAAPDQLYIGCRFAGVNKLAARAADKFCDVVSYNIYCRKIADSQFIPGKKPVLIGEFHFGALDRGLFHSGLVPVANQQERAQAYKDYLLEAARHPLFVGAHWFQWGDQPVTGRPLDEENYQIGFLDVADTPYPELISASREVAAEMYKLRAGR